VSRFFAAAGAHLSAHQTPRLVLRGDLVVPNGKTSDVANRLRVTTPRFPARCPANARLEKGGGKSQRTNAQHDREMGLESVYREKTVRQRQCT
jgi:hypothetical protein